MPLFTKRPVTVEAHQWDGDNLKVIQDFCHKAFFDGATLTIATLEGDMTANVDDWIIRGVAGEFYPCKPDIFKETYSEEVRCD